MQVDESHGTSRTCMVTSIYAGWLQQTEGLGDIQRQVNKRVFHQDGTQQAVLKLLKSIYLYFYFMCMDALPSCMSVHQVTLRGKEGDRFCGTAVTDRCGPPYGWKESDSDTLEQPWAISPATSWIFLSLIIWNSL